jgi:hypothetical protein
VTPTTRRRSESREAASVGGLAIKAPIAAVADPRDVASSLRISRPAEHAPPGRVDLAAPDLQLHMTGPRTPSLGEVGGVFLALERPSRWARFLCDPQSESCLNACL